MKSFILMLQFLTHLPIAYQVPCDEADFKEGLRWFSLVGLVLGLVHTGALYWLSRLGLGPWELALVATVLHIMTTGALHLDGVADSADGLLSNRSPDRMLEIMKDSRVGSNGVVALMVNLSLKALAYHLLIRLGLWWGVVLMPMVGRLACVMACMVGKTPRQAGMGNLFIGKASPKTLFLNALLVIFISLVSNPMFIATALVSLLWTYALVKGSTQKIEGITGDVLGLIIETSEVVFGLMTGLVILGGL